MKLECQAGLYEIVNTVTSDRYIGSTSRKIWERFAGHRARLRNGKGPKRLQASWDQHGEEAFEFRPLLVCAPDMARYYEQELVRELQPALNSLAVCNEPTSMPKTTRMRMSEAQQRLGRKAPTTVERMTTARRNRMKRYKIRGEELTAPDILEKYGVAYYVMYARMKTLGWSLERAATTPVNPLGTNQFGAPRRC